jgi:hypothetical protein
VPGGNAGHAGGGFNPVEAFLEGLRAQLGHEPKRVIVSLPNVAFIVVRVMLLHGQFNYGKAGILDRTRSRLYTFRAARCLVRDGGFSLRSMRRVPAPLPKVLGVGWLGRLAVSANHLLIRLGRSLFAYQIFIEADSTPDVDFPVRDAEAGTRGGGVTQVARTGWRFRWAARSGASLRSSESP